MRTDVLIRPGYSSTDLAASIRADISVSGGPSTVDVTDLAVELGIHSGSLRAVLDSH